MFAKDPKFGVVVVLPKREVDEVGAVDPKRFVDGAGPVRKEEPVEGVVEKLNWDVGC